ncbi:MAG: hypothetical protein ABFD69_01180 [Candidatus Sumerlaeia bacterium]
MGAEIKRAVRVGLKSAVITLPLGALTALAIIFFPHAVQWVVWGIKWIAIVFGAFFVFMAVTIIVMSDIVPRVQRRKWRGRAEPASEDFRNWLMAQIRTLRSLDFFKADKELSDEALFEKLMARITDEYGDELTELRVRPCMVGALDEERVLIQDMEDDGCLNEDGWVEFIRNWARISRGAFRPENIEARLDADETRAEVRFDAGGRRHTLVFKVDGDWLDFTFADKLDPFVADAGFRYEVERSDHGQCSFLVVINDEEAKRLRTEAGWNV